MTRRGACVCASFVAGFAVSAVFAGTSHADPVCGPACDPKAAGCCVEEERLLADRGATRSGMVRFDLAPLSFGVERGHMLGAVGFGLAVTPWSPPHPDGIRVLTFGARGYLGDFGDRRRGPGFFQAGWEPEFQLPIDTSAVHVYLALPLLDWTVSPIRGRSGAHHALSAGGGIGFELLDGALGFQATTATVFALDDRFRTSEASRGQIWAQRGELRLSTNGCFWWGGDGFCNHPAPVAEQIDLSEVLKLQVQAKLSSPTGRPAACEALDAAVSVSGYEPACISTNAAEQFFCRLKKASAGKPYEASVSSVADARAALDACYESFQADAQAARRVGRTPRLAEQYLVDPSELSRVAGCESSDGGGDPLPPRPAAFVADGAAVARACEVCPAACRGIESR
jgi:hypothetical protein